MESIIARALEYTLKYWLKSFSRDQFKLQGRTVQLSNLDINGDAVHSSIGLPPALNVVTAKVGKLEIKLPYLSYVQVEPIVVEIDRLDLVLKESSDFEAGATPESSQSATTAAKGSGYGFADKIADGMTLVVGVVNLLIEPRGGAQGQGGATWASPLASITIRNLSLCTTNENWQVVSLKEARDFSNNKKYIYVFKKLEWESLSIDLLPHPDMFIDADMMGSKNGVKRDDDGAKRVFFGGERFLEGISGQAHITIQRTDLNSPLGLEVQLHITEALCPALSEPGLRALLRFMTGVYVCLNRGDVDPAAKQRSAEAAGCSLVSIAVDHIFLCIKDADFQLELLMQSLFFSRASVSDGGNTRNLSRITVSGLFLRDTFSHPPCTLVQPLMQSVTDDSLNIPDFAKDFCPQIYPLGDQLLLNDSVPIICLHSLQTQPSPAPPTFASQTVIDCQPLMINLQEEACLRISSFLADGIVVGPGAVLPDSSINFLLFNLKKLDLTVFMDAGENSSVDVIDSLHSPFGGARLHIENLSFTESPSLKFRLLNLDKDPACFCLWEDQPVDASQKKWTTRASKISLSLETSTSLTKSKGLWRCVELNEICVEAAMVTADGSPINVIPPPGGIVRIGVACEQYISNTSVEQLFFVLDLYAYLGRVSEKIAIVGKTDRQEFDKRESLAGKLMENVPSDTAVSLQMKDLQLRFLETSSTNVEGMPLVQFIGENLFVKVGHRTLGGAMAVSSTVCWESVQVDCVDADGYLTSENLTVEIPNGNNGHPHLRSVFWINNSKSHTHRFNKPIPFLDINIVHVIPYNARDTDSHTLSVSAKVAGVRLGGGMNYAEALLHRFGVIGPDGGPGDGLSKGLKHLSDGPLSKLLRASPIIEEMEDKSCEDGDGFLELGKPDDVDVSIELKDWLFALEGAQEIAERWWFDGEDISREERCWHTTFQSLRVKAKSKPNGTEKSSSYLPKYPVDLVTVGVEGLQALKPQHRKGADNDKGTVINSGGVNVEVRLVTSNDNDSVEMPDWAVENLKFSVKQPIEAVVTKEEVQHLAVLCKSEVESMGRITAGILRVLKLDTSIGQSAIDQLSNLGSDGLDKMFTPERQSNGSIYDLMRSPSPRAVPSLESTITSLEVAVLESQANCSRLIEEMNTDLSAQHVLEMKQLSEKLESMQSLLSRMRSQI